MFKFTNGTIEHTRGDTADFDITVKENGSPIADSYTAVFSVKRGLLDKNYLFQVPVNDGHVHISHADTKDLKCGDYYYDIEIRIDDGSVEGRYVTAGPFRYRLLSDVTTT